MKYIVKQTIMIILLLGLLQCSQQKKVRIFLIGDSTSAEYDSTRYPLTGWGMKLPLFFNKNATIYNYAESGSSTKRFTDWGNWGKVSDSLNSGDYLIIQFGHNDSHKDNKEQFADANTDYRNNLIRYITEARKKGVIPILATPISRRKYENGVLMKTHGDYPSAMKKVAKEMNVPVLDLTTNTIQLVEEYGEENSKKLFMWVEPGRYATYPDGKKDNTHLAELGAKEVASIAAKEIMKLDLDLKNYIINSKMK